MALGSALSILSALGAKDEARFRSLVIDTNVLVILTKGDQEWN